MKNLIGFGVVIVIAAIAGYFFLFNKTKSTEDIVPVTNQEETAPVTQVPPASSAPAPTTTLAPTPVSVSIASFAFSPATMTVKKGTKVTWTNNDQAPHTVTGDVSGPSSPTLANGASYSFIFTNEGTFQYHCNFHPSMKGTVTVTE